MISKKNTIIISICAGAIVIAGGMFGIYKHFVTPERIIGLSLINAGKDAMKTIQHYNDDDERELIESMSEKGGKITADFTLSDSAILNGTDFSITSNSDGSCTVSEIEIGDIITVTAYKDDSRMYINTPLFDGGFEIPVEDFAQKWNTSIFKDIAVLPESGIFDAYQLLKDNANDILSSCYAKITQLQADGSGDFTVTGVKNANILIGSKTKRAKEYSINISNAGYNELCDAAIACISDQSEAETVDLIDSILRKNTEDLIIKLKLNGIELREIGIEGQTSGSTHTIALEGEDNPFNDILYYTNGDTKNALRRIHSESSGKLTENLQLGGTTEFTFEESMNELKAELSADGFEISLDARGKDVDDDQLSFSNAVLKCGDLLTLSGRISFSKYYDEDFSFSKSGQYVNLLEISQEEWETITGVLLKGIDFLL